MLNKCLMISIIKIAKYYGHLMHSVGATDGTLTIKTLNSVAQLLSYPWVKKLYNNPAKESQEKFLG